MNKKVLSRLLSYCRPYKTAIMFVFLLSLASAALMLMVPILLGQAIDLLIGANQVDLHMLLEKLMFIAGVIVLTSTIQWGMGQITNTITYQMTNDLRNKVFDKIQVLPIHTIDTTGHGDILGRLINDIDLIGQGLLQSFTSLISGVSTIAGTIIIMGYIHLTTALIVVVLTPLSLLVASVIVKRTHSYFKTQLEIRGQMNKFTEEMIGNQKIINSFSFNQQNEEEFNRINNEMHENGVIQQFYGALVNPTTRLVNSTVYASVGIYGALQVLNGVFSVGILSSFLTYANQYTKPFNEISSVMSEMQTALAASARVFALLDQKEIVEEYEEIKPNKKGHIQIQNICFSYSKDKPLIENFNYEAFPGQMTAIVGKTGCGKTTLINLLMRFYEVNSGSILVDGQNIQTMNRNDLRSLYGMVLQDSWLFKGTIKENIAYGKQDATDNEIIEAAKRARVHKFIMAMPQGYDTLVEEDGGNISQGQKQLISIARIMLSKPPMLILDEATSSIDTRTELQVQAAFDEMMKGRTSFVVAHRLSTIVNADNIIVMDSGHIVEVGNHQELLKKHGYYYQLYNSQFQIQEKNRDS